LRNLITSLQMLLQVGNSNREVTMMVQNLLQALGQPAYPLLDFEVELVRRSERAGPRPFSARNLDYWQDDGQPVLKAHYPGYLPFEEPIYPDWNAINLDTHLNTVESIHAQTNVIAGAESDVRYDELHNHLYDRNENVVGNLQALQTGNAIALMTTDGIRRTEKSLAGIANLMAVRNAHDLQKEAWGEAVLRHSLELATAGPMPLYNGGEGGIKYVAPLQGGGF
jgi:hypothetical protein